MAGKWNKRRLSRAKLGLKEEKGGGGEEAGNGERYRGCLVLHDPLGLAKWNVT